MPELARLLGEDANELVADDAALLFGVGDARPGCPGTSRPRRRAPAACRGASRTSRPRAAARRVAAGRCRRRCRSAGRRSRDAPAPRPPPSRRRPTARRSPARRRPARRMSSIAWSTNDGRRPVAGAAAHVAQEIAEELRAEAGVHDLGMELDARSGRRRSTSRRPASCRWWPRSQKPGGSVRTTSPWLIQTENSGGRPAKDRRRRIARRAAPPGRIRACVPGSTSPPS